MTSMTQQSDTNTLTIVLATTIPVLFVLIVLIALYFFYTRRKGPFLRRGVTPIGDDEIESWKIVPYDEKASTPRESQSQGRGPSTSVSSAQKPASVIVYQPPRGSEDFVSPTSTRGPRQSIDNPRSPVLARAPNSRPGLTDETVQGDDAFVPSVKRYPSRLAKSNPTSPRSMRESNLYSATRDYWYGSETDVRRSPRRSADTYTRRPVSHHPGHRRVYSTSSGPPPPLYCSDDDVLLGGLSPPPVVRKSEIGRAIG